MKTNKKAILGMLVAMVMSLGMMGAVNNRASNNDLTVQQVGLGSAIVNDTCFEGQSQTCGYISNLAAGTAASMAAGGALASVVTTTNPVGWGYWAVTGAIAL